MCSSDLAETMIIVPFAVLLFIALNKVDQRVALTSVSCLVLSAVTLVMYYFMIPTHFPKMSLRLTRKMQRS